MVNSTPKYRHPLEAQQERIEHLEQERVRLNRLLGDVDFELDKAYEITRHLTEGR